ALEEALTGLRRRVREADSSLIDEWERLQRPDVQVQATTFGGPVGPTAKEISARIRSELHRLLKAVAEKAWDDVLACLATGQDWTADSLAAEAEPYFAANERIVLTPEARRPSMAGVRSAAPGPREARPQILSPAPEPDLI